LPQFKDEATTSAAVYPREIIQPLQVVRRAQGGMISLGDIYPTKSKRKGKRLPRKQGFVAPIHPWAGVANRHSLLFK